MGTSLSRRCLTDAQGQFELKPANIPVDAETDEDVADCHVLAMHPQKLLYGMTPVRIGDAGKSTDVAVILRPHPADAPLSLPNDLTKYETDDHPDHGTTLLLGQPAPELNCPVWLNGDEAHYTLESFRGNFVLIDLWATWCGPCHFDFPKLKLLHDSYKDHGLVIVGLHDNSVPIEAIRDHVDHEKIEFLVAVDHRDGRTVDRYKAAGMQGYPSYLLIDPQGIVVEMDDVVGRPNLRKRMLSIVRSHLLKEATSSR